MAQHTHRFVEEYDGLVGFGLDRETDENTIVYYLQKFSDDGLMNLLKKRLSTEEMDIRPGSDRYAVVSSTNANWDDWAHLSEEEYHGCFLKDRE